MRALPCIPTTAHGHHGHHRTVTTAGVTTPGPWWRTRAAAFPVKPSNPNSLLQNLFEPAQNLVVPRPLPRPRLWPWRHRCRRPQLRSTPPPAHGGRPRVWLPPWPSCCGKPAQKPPRWRPHGRGRWTTSGSASQTVRWHLLTALSTWRPALWSRRRQWKAAQFLFPKVCPVDPRWACSSRFLHRVWRLCRSTGP